ncbi:hypothetical protein RI543_003794 [Arxiozyma heterogenica]|uniref:Uncharacterized protein n=1 Tax=Arxiozyma heterogenica TaxID=278026 RepID=A0AAN7WFQ1_9SACH|nr:hypothetical protein RI543_003794 [Kazachstania heterogenica]
MAKLNNLYYATVEAITAPFKIDIGFILHEPLIDIGSESSARRNTAVKLTKKLQAFTLCTFLDSFKILYNLDGNNYPILRHSTAPGASMAKLVRRHTSNVEIIGSNPIGSTAFFFIDCDNPMVIEYIRPF